MMISIHVDTRAERSRKITSWLLWVRSVDFVTDGSGGIVRQLVVAPTLIFTYRLVTSQLQVHSRSHHNFSKTYNTPDKHRHRELADPASIETNHPSGPCDDQQMMAR